MKPESSSETAKKLKGKYPNLFSKQMKKLVDDGKISMSNAMVVSKLPINKQNAFLIRAQNLNKEKLEEHVKRILS